MQQSTEILPQKKNQLPRKEKTTVKHLKLDLGAKSSALAVFFNVKKKTSYISSIHQNDWKANIFIDKIITESPL